MSTLEDQWGGVVANIIRRARMRVIDDEAMKLFKLMLNEVGDVNPLIYKLVKSQWECLDARREFEISESTLKACVHKAISTYNWNITTSEELDEYSRVTKIISNFKLPITPEIPADNPFPLVNEAVPLADDNPIPPVDEAVGLGLILHPKPLEPYVLTQCRPAIDRAAELQQDPDLDLVCFGWTCFLPPFLRSMIEWFTG